MALVGATSLGQYLVKKGVISEGQLLNALKLQKSEGIQIGTALIKLKYLTEDQLVHTLSEIYGYRLINLLHTEIDINAFKLIPEEVIKSIKLYHCQNRQCYKSSDMQSIRYCS